jgi:hypothetical protein
MIYKPWFTAKGEKITSEENSPFSAVNVKKTLPNGVLQIYAVY